MMTSCDVLIVGGGPSGSSLAWTLRGRGMEVMLLDKKSFPRDKVCAGWITPPIVDALQLDLDDYSREHVLQPISGFNVRRIGNKEIRIRYNDGPVSYGIRRCEFDHYLLDRCGIRPVTDTPVRTLERRQGYWVVNDAIKTPMLVGAGGHFCPVARYLGANPGLSELAVAAQEIEFKMNPEQLAACTVEGQIPELYFCEDLKGYGWIFRKDDYLNIGIGREDQHGLSRHVAEFCRYLEALGKLPPAVSEKFKGHAYLLYQHADRRIVDDGVMLIGDAAGLAYTQSGEGIRPAVESALLAAEVIKEAGGNYSMDSLQRYAGLIRGRFGKRPVRSMVDRLPIEIKKQLAGTLLSMEFFVRSVVIERWFLHRQGKTLSVKG